MPNLINLINKKFGRWTVVSRAGNNQSKRPLWLCLCVCGNQKIVDGQALRQGDSKSCGCLNIEVHRQTCIDRNTTHGLTQSKAYDTWVNIKQRCFNPKCTGYKKYGAKGIRVCERWLSFENFLEDIGHPPTDKHTIDRINSSGDYTPENCRWSLMKDQQNNRTNNRLITFKGETKTLMQWAETTGIMRETIARRLDLLKWPIERALAERPRKMRQ